MMMRGEVDKLKILLALIFIFEGLHIAVLRTPLIKIHEGLRLFGVLLMVLGTLYIYYQYKSVRVPKEQDEPVEKSIKIYESTRDARIKAHLLKPKAKKGEPEAEPVPEEKSILTRFMGWIFQKTEVISPYMLPIIGAVIIDAVLIYNIMVQKSLDLYGFDAITIMFGVSLILYNYLPKQFSFARDFFVFFLGLLFLILVFPPIFYDQLVGSGGTAAVTKIFLGDPLAGLLNLGGIESSSEIITQGGKETATIYFPLAQTGEQASVGIAEGCSGIYTASIFLAAFITFILMEYRRFDLKVGVLIGLGILTSYIANIFRMTIIVLVGHYYDTVAIGEGALTNLSWAHVNAGWLIFLAWIIPFWFLMYRFLMKKDLSKGEEQEVDAGS